MENFRYLNRNLCWFSDFMRPSEIYHIFCGKILFFCLIKFYKNGQFYYV
jgi:hypothetical protein